MRLGYRSGPVSVSTGAGGGLVVVMLMWWFYILAALAAVAIIAMCLAVGLLWWIIDTIVHRRVRRPTWIPAMWRAWQQQKGHQ